MMSKTYRGGYFNLTLEINKVCNYIKNKTLNNCKSYTEINKYYNNERDIYK